MSTFAATRAQGFRLPHGNVDDQWMWLMRALYQELQHLCGRQLELQPDTP
ncbi:MAG: hypothetical protein WD042_05520 [Phycisphaeraceae bacterium]